MSDFFRLDGQVAVITGGTSGIGLKAAERFIDAGAKVVISGRKDGTEIAEKIGVTHGHLRNCLSGNRSLSKPAALLLARLMEEQE